MAKEVIVFLIFILAIHLAYSISIKELITKYSFSTATPQINITSHVDFMTDKNNNGINDTLIFELTTSNTAGTFIFVINLFDKNGILTNETNRTLNVGINKINITFNSIFLTQNQFNYSIKIYNSTYSLKYRKDNILTQSYSNYEEGFKILAITDSKIDKTLKINITTNYSLYGTFETILFLGYNNSIISKKENKSIITSIQDLIFNFDNETIKRTHHTGNFNISSLKIDKKITKTNFTTSFYNFKDFATTSYISNFADDGIDTNNDNKYNFLQINTSIQVLNENNYTLILAFYDLFDNIIEIKNISYFLNIGKNILPFSINGSKIYNKKLNGPFIVKYVNLFENEALVDQINNAHLTKNYNFNDFDKPNLPDLTADISVSDGYHYGISNITINFTFKNIGNKHAFNVFTEIFDNSTFFKSNKSNVLDINSQIEYQINFTNVTDFEVSAIADLQDLIEELNKNNNAERIIVKLNKKPNLELVSNMTFNETDKIIINLSASDPNEDKLIFSINLSKFSNNSNIFQWSTTTTDSGEYALNATASDGFLDDSIIFKILIFDVPEKDVDNDGINDSIDKLIGNENSINTSTINLTIFLDNSSNLSRLFNETFHVRFIDNNSTIAEFEFDFWLYKLNLTNLTINKQSANTTGSLVFNGLKLSEGMTKTLYVDKINATLNGLCIKDEEILTINEISNSCSSNNEFKVECDGVLQNSYICTYNSTSNKYKVQGLGHSGIIQIAYTKPASESSSNLISTGSSSAAGGGGIVCISNWQCSEWSQCINGFKNRKCSDTNHCAFPTKKPIELQECFVNGTEEKFVKRENITKEDMSTDTGKKNEGLLSGITGQVVKLRPNVKTFADVIDILAVALVFLITYLTIRSIFSQ